MRTIHGLRWARLSTRPAGLPKATARRGAKGLGLRYERSVAAAIPCSIHGQWFEFEDENGRGYCQPDIIAQVLGDCILILEVKYTWTLEGHRQLEELYSPVLSAAFGRKVCGMVVARRIVPEMPGVQVVGKMGDGLEEASMGRRVCLQWLGEGVIPESGICKAFPAMMLVA